MAPSPSSAAAGDSSLLRCCAPRPPLGPRTTSEATASSPSSFPAPPTTCLSPRNRRRTTMTRQKLPQHPPRPQNSSTGGRSPTLVCAIASSTSEFVPLPIQGRWRRNQSRKRNRRGSGASLRRRPRFLTCPVSRTTSTSTCSIGAVPMCSPSLTATPSSFGTIPRSPPSAPCVAWTVPSPVSAGLPGQNIAIGLIPSCNLEIFDLVSRRTRRVMSDSDLHFGTRVTSLAWKDDNVLATAGPDREILLHDLRLGSPVVQTFRAGHDGDIYALKWSDSGRYLASGGDVDLLHIWDVCMTTSTAHRKPWLHRMTDHTSTVKALAWCPFQNNLLASGGNSDDCCIKFWNTSIGCLLNSVDTGGAEVFSLQWSRHARQLISSHGGPRNQLNVWRYPSMAKAGELIGHQDRALFTSQSPDGYAVASASTDESAMLWKFCADSSEVPKPKPKVPNWGPFSSSSFSHIRKGR